MIHSTDEVVELLRILDIEEDQIEALIGEQKMEMTHSFVNQDALVAYFNIFQYDETWDHIFHQMGGDISKWIAFIDRHDLGEPVHAQGVKTLLKLVFTHFNPWFNYKKAWENLLADCDNHAANPAKLKDEIIRQLFESPEKKLESYRILQSYVGKAKFSNSGENWEYFSDEEFKEMVELEDSVPALKDVLKIWIDQDEQGKIELYEQALEKIVQETEELDDIRFVWDSIKACEQISGRTESDTRFKIRRLAFSKYKFSPVEVGFV